MQRMVYECGFPFSAKLAENLLDLKERVVVGNKAAMIIIDGMVGEGKTTLGVHCADSIQDSLIDLSYQYGMGGLSFLRNSQATYKAKRNVLIYDEAGDFSKRGSISGFNQMMVRAFETYRAFKIVVIAILPSYLSLDNSLDERGIPRLLLHCYGRDEKQGNFSAYGFERMQYLKHYASKMVVKAKAYGRVEPNFRGHFLDLDVERREELRLISMQGKLRIFQEAEIAQSGLMSVHDIARKAHLTVRTVQRKLHEHGLMPVRKMGQKHYYDKGIMGFFESGAKK